MNQVNLSHVQIHILSHPPTLMHAHMQVLTFTGMQTCTREHSNTHTHRHTYTKLDVYIVLHQRDV